MNDETKTKAEGSCCGPSCCGGAKVESQAVPAAAGAMTGGATDPHAVRDLVREGYAKIAKSGTWNASKAQKASAAGCCDTEGMTGGGCCGPSTFTPEQLAQAIGYSQAELDASPDAANMGLSCGNPTALASRPFPRPARLDVP